MFRIYIHMANLGLSVRHCWSKWSSMEKQNWRSTVRIQWYQIVQKVGYLAGTNIYLKKSFLHNFYLTSAYVSKSISNKVTLKSGLIGNIMWAVYLVSIYWLPLQEIGILSRLLIITFLSFLQCFCNLNNNKKMVKSNRKCYFYKLWKWFFELILTKIFFLRL